MNLPWYLWLWIVFFIGIHAWAFLTAGPADPEVEKLWDNMRGM